jgi:chromosome segregation ATPase
MIGGNTPPASTIASTSDFLEVLKLALDGDRVKAALGELTAAYDKIEEARASMAAESKAMSEERTKLTDDAKALQAANDKVKADAAELARLRAIYEDDIVQLESDRQDVVDGKKYVEKLVADAQKATELAAGKLEAANSQEKEAAQLMAQAEETKAAADARAEKLRAAIEGNA